MELFQVTLLALTSALLEVNWNILPYTIWLITAIHTCSHLKMKCLIKYSMKSILFQIPTVPNCWWQQRQVTSIVQSYKLIAIEGAIQKPFLVGSNHWCQYHVLSSCLQVVQQGSIGMSFFLPWALFLLHFWKMDKDWGWGSNTYYIAGDAKQ
jgi:hypothetical protein